MTLLQYTAVRLQSDAHADEGVPRGSIGVILDVYDDGDYEVEFSREDGTTIAWFAVRGEEVEPVRQQEGELLRRAGD